MEEKPFWHKVKMIVGVDEAGRGPLAGAVVGVALYLKNKPFFLVKDSKKLSSTKRQEIFCWLLENSLFFIGIATVQEIDELNILGATFLAFERAIVGLLRKEPILNNAEFIIDGPLFKTNLNLKYTCIEKADEKICEVACASIVAKVTRDYLMHVGDFLFSEWNFSKHKGYPTPEHIYLIKKYSLSPIHRKTFKPCMQLACNL
ncbi:MAG: ribonuclease HII [Candidatus Omnitrophica bacterium]|nr:ribonuclease HII [Candidatus Omnitrophota bacterium]MCM8831255.1 ribonuclease HII [Candidatus Omnitrophota bacterium]